VNPQHLADLADLADLDATEATATAGSRPTKATTKAAASANANATATTNAEPAISEFVVLVDSREQAPWQFHSIFTDTPGKPPKPLVVRTRVATLRTGDYSIEKAHAAAQGHPGTPHACAIERKSLADLWGTLGAGRERFERELQRLSQLDRAAVIVESSWLEILGNAPGHPAELSRLTRKAVLHSIIAWQIEYPEIQWILAGNRVIAERIAWRWLFRFHEKRVGWGQEHQPPGQPEQQPEQPPEI
jgi:ERCC4-type nuclease